MNSKIGLIAGNGNLPLVVANRAKTSGRDVFVCAIKGETDPKISEMAKEIEWVVLGQLHKLTNFFKSNQVTEALMAGKITKTNLFKGELKPDLEMVKVIMKVRDRKDDTLLGAVADYLSSKGIRLLNSVTFLQSELPKAGVLSKQKPNRSDEEEIEFGWQVAKQIGGLDIGQTVVTKKKAVIAVEAIEGTDEAILRAGELVSGELNIFKVAKPKQDMRFDVPTIGMKTLECMIQVGARMLVIEADKTILLDREEFLAKANEHKIIIIAK